MSVAEPNLADLRVLIVDDETDVRRGLHLQIELPVGELRKTRRGDEALELLEQWTPHLILADITRDQLSGMKLLTQVRSRWPKLEVVIITGCGTIELAVEAMRQGAANFFSKPLDNRRITAEVERLGQRALLAERERRIAGAPAGPATLIAEDPAMVRVLELARQVAPTTMPVLIRGESGTGKELVACTIHQGSRDPSLPFLPVNAAALPDNLLESELFGYVKGAFTGATSHRDGIFAQARGGTVFLDEIALMSPAFQGKLLRVLQEHTIVPLGSSAQKPVEFRLVAATGRRLRELISAGEFREDLYYRLRVVSINIPPLRERPADIVPLATHFLARYSNEAGFSRTRPPQLTSEAIEALKRHRWPGNVRELENSIQRALILCRGRDIGSRHLGLDEESIPWSRDQTAELSYKEGQQKVLDTYRHHAISRALRTTRGNVTRAAELCGLTRAAFQRLMRSLAIDPAQFKDDR